MILFLAITAIAWIVLAADNAERIEEGKPINHELNGAVFAACAFLCGAFWGWGHIVTSLLWTRVTFDLALAYHRELPFDYVTPKPTSKVDKLEQMVFGKNGWLPKLIYLVIVVLMVLV